MMSHKILKKREKRTKKKYATFISLQGKDRIEMDSSAIQSQVALL